MKTALISDWIVSLGGAEKCLQEIASLFPAPIFTLVYRQEMMKSLFSSTQTFHASFLQKFPFSTKKHAAYLPLFPLAIEQFDLRNYDLLLSSSHCVAKGVLTSPDQWHICYCHTPMRYAWDLHADYLQQISSSFGIKRLGARLLLHYLRGWDVHSSHRVDAFIANSSYVASRIQKTYQRKAHVIYPPVDTTFFTLKCSSDNFYITLSRLVPYKRVDLLVSAFQHMPEKTLLVVGEGREKKRLKKIATKNVLFLGHQSAASVKELLQKAKGALFASLEDFGIASIEAQACGTPVIGYGKGGFRETILDGKTGITFPKQTVGEVIQAISRFETMQDHFCPLTIRTHAKTFSKERFHKEFSAFVSRSYREKTRFS